jgi:hypothetical protein
MPTADQSAAQERRCKVLFAIRSRSAAARLQIVPPGKAELPSHEMDGVRR